MQSYFRTVLSVLLVCAGYYAGGLIGVSVRFPPSGVSVIWPATPVLLAALLLTPVRLWWVYVLAILPTHVHLVTHFQPGVPIVIMLSQYAGNVLHALLGAVAVRPFIGSPPRLDNLQSMAAFITLAAIAASAVASAVVLYLFVLTGWTSDYWLVWRRRVLSQILGAITVTPIILMMVSRSSAAWLKLPPRYYLELSLLTIGLFAVGIPAFSWSTPGAGSFLGLLFAPLPLLLWGAVRLGSNALCFLCLVVALLSLSNTFAGRGPFATLSPAENVLSLQIFLIAISVPLMFLAALIEERRSKEQALRFSEARYRAVVEDQTELICRFLPDGTYTFVNDAYCRYFQHSREDLLGSSFWSFIPPEGHPAAREFLASITPEHQVATREHEVLAPNGELRWQQWRDRGFFDEQGRVVEYQAVGRDVTERKRAEQTLRENEAVLRASYARIQELVGKLITAQEAERSRIARDLHDDVNQQLASVSIALSHVKRQVQKGGDAIAEEEITRLQQRTIDLVDVIRHLSHELHPGVLRHAGLIAALQGHCAEFGRQHAIEVTLAAADGLDGIPQDIALCLYRVAQETLRNIAAHAGARQVQVSLRATEEGLELLIADDGEGFNLAEARSIGGLGLISLDERVRLVGGSLAIHTELKRGTEIRVQVPLRGRR